MTGKSLFNVLISAAVIIVSAAVAIGAVRLFGWGLGNVTFENGPAARLAFGLTAPFGVVLFALLVEQAGRVTDRLVPAGPQAE